MQKYYMVLCAQTGYSRYKHESYQSAKDEAVRLARQNPGNDFVVLLGVATVKKNDVVIDELERDEIPF